jgi:hypothetical protein
MWSNLGIDNRMLIQKNYSKHLLYLFLSIRKTPSIYKLQIKYQASFLFQSCLRQGYKFQMDFSRY